MPRARRRTLHPAGRADRGRRQGDRSPRSRGGKSLDAAAREKGLADGQGRPGDPGRSSPARPRPRSPQAAFAAAQGALAAPARGGLGWYVLRVDAIDRTAGAHARRRCAARSPPRSPRSSAARRSSDLTAEHRGRVRRRRQPDRRRRASSGSTLAPRPPPVTADGAVYGTAGAGRAADLAPVLPTAFAMEARASRSSPRSSRARPS